MKRETYRATVRYRTQAYHARLHGKSASSTMSAEEAVRRVAEKAFGPGQHLLLLVKDCTAGQPGEWEVSPAAKDERATFTYKLKSASGYGAEGCYDNVTPNQYRQIVAALEGTLREAPTAAPPANAWHPHTDKPTEICNALIAVADEGLGEDGDPWFMLPAIFNWHPASGWVEEKTGTRLIHTEFWWVREDDLLAPLKGVKHG